MRFALLALAVACNSGKSQPHALVIAIDPATAIVQVSGTVSFTAPVTGGTDTAVSWAVREGAAGGSVTQAGLYTAPATPGTYHIDVTSHADASKTASAVVTVTQGPPPALALIPKSVAALTGGTVQFSATVTGLADTAVSFAVDEGAAGGIISSTGLYTAPTTAGLYHVTATSHGNAALTDKAVLTVSGPASGSPGVWQNVTPAAVNLGPDYPSPQQNYGIQDVVVDPVRPSDFYAFICYQGVWKSTDYGLTWTKVSAAGGPLEAGRPWSAAIDPNPNRNPAVAPALYTMQGYGPQLGLYKSTDGGITFNQIWTDPGGYGNDVYTIDIDPSDSGHLLVTFHGHNKLAESKDAGVTWTGRGAIGQVTQSSYIFFLTSSVWIAVSQWDTNTNGVWRTEDSGLTWTHVNNNEHFHGCSQVVRTADGSLYLPGSQGILRSTDLGKTWTTATSTAANTVVGTASFLYANFGWANQSGWDANMLRADASNGTNWASYITKPAAMTNGSKRSAVSFNGTHYVVVSGNWLAGLWRYVEN